MNQERIMQILMRPLLTEKSTRVGDTANQYVFHVLRDANKQEIKQAVHSLFDVEVESVRTVNVKGKERGFGRVKGRTNSWKKAYVRLGEGQEINFVGNL